MKKVCRLGKGGPPMPHLHMQRENYRALNFNCIHHIELVIQSNQIHSLDSTIYVFDPAGSFSYVRSNTYTIFFLKTRNATNLED